MLVDEGMLSAMEYESMRMQLLAFVNEPSAIAMMINLLLLGSKPVVSHSGHLSEGSHAAGSISDEGHEINLDACTGA